MIETTIYIAIIAAIFGLGAVAGATWMRQRKSSINDSQGWWML